MGLTGLGLIKTTLIDFPGEVAATVFTPGCNLHCPYCHNPDLVIPPFPRTLLPMEEVRRFLTKRAAVLGGVCITGGEPLIHGGAEGELIRFIHFCKNLGLKVKVDTNGCFPDRLKKLLTGSDGVDYIAMDIKTLPEKYNAVAAPSRPYDSDTARSVMESIEGIIASGIKHEFRTTMAPGIAGTAEALEIAGVLLKIYADFNSVSRGKYILAQFRPGKTLEPKYSDTIPYANSELRKTAEAICKSGITCEVRGI